MSPIRRTPVRAVVVPTAIATAAGTGAGVAAGLGWAAAGVGAVAGVGIGSLALTLARGRGRATRTAVGPDTDRRAVEALDPFALGDPWRRFVQGALRARTRFSRAVEAAPAGPRRERLGDIAARVDAAVLASWRVAERGHALSRALGQIDAAGARRALADPALPGAARDAIEAQLASHARLQALVSRARDDLAVLDARLDEAVARAVELATLDTGGTAMEPVAAGISAVVDELGALAAALDETRPA